MKVSTVSSALIAVVVVTLTSLYRAHAFVPTCQFRTGGNKRTASSILWYAGFPDTLSEMKASEMKKELESYGISTKSMFDKKEFEKALTEARLAFSNTDKEKETILGKAKDKENNKTKREKWSTKWNNVASAAKEALDSHTKPSTSNPSSTGKSSSNREESGSPSSSSSSSSSANTRQERYELALEEGRAMKLSSLKKELQDRGISTSSFFEKSDLLKAYANAIADYVKVKSSRANTTSRSDESFDPSYRTVIMHAFDPSTILAAGDVIIDVTETVQ